MQFQFKRPQTSKSTSQLHHRTLRNISPASALQFQQAPSEEPQNPTKKWEQAAHKINKEMFYHRMMNPNTEPFKLLTRIGGRTFKSQSKEQQR